MYKSHSSIETPDDEIKIWRYMDFTKLVSLLDQSKLFLTRSDGFSDKFEGTYPTLIKSRREKISNQDIANQIVKISDDRRKRTFINCWHINEYESAAMWKLYLQSGEGVVIQSTIGKLKESLEIEERNLYIGKVQYMDYNQGSIPGNCPLKTFVHKRYSFAHEQEVRIIYQVDKELRDKQVDPDSPKGELIECNLESLIENIYVAPDSPGWFKDVVTSICKKYDVNVEVKQSNLDDIAY